MKGWDGWRGVKQSRLLANWRLASWPELLCPSGQLASSQQASCRLAMRRSRSSNMRPHTNNTMSARHSQFDAAYYDRFYGDPRTRVTAPEERAQQVALAIAVLNHQNVEVTRILDAGCGLGYARKPLLRAFPNATYTGLEVSEYLCRKYGWIHSSVVEYRDRAPFDFVICSDVVQYLSDRDAARAINNLARLCRGVLYFHTPTLEDLRGLVDEEGSDTNVHFRSAEFYRTRLRRHFHHLGFGLHLARKHEVMQWELEKAC